MTIDQAMAVAIQHHQAGDVARAQNIYRQILAAAPAHADALHLLGVAAHQSGRAAEAADLIGRAITLNPNSHDYHCNLGVVLGAMGRHEEAVAAHHRALALEPDSAGAFNNLGYSLQQLEKIDEAINAGRQAVALGPFNPSAHNNFGTALLAHDELDAAIACFRCAAALQPSFADAHNNLGKALYAKGRVDEAIACLRTAVAMRADYPEAYSNLGTALCDKEQWQEAIDCCKKSLTLRPDYPAGHWNLAVMLLRQGKLEQGWIEYEWRWQVKGLRQKLALAQPYWGGEPLNGRRILIHAEQGLGDTIQFLRYLPHVVQRGGKVILAAQPELLGLLKDVPGIEALVSSSQTLPGFEVHCPLLSLPRVLKTTLATIPATVPYLSADPQKQRHWADRLAGERKKIGLVWAGRAGHTNDRNRSFPVSTYAPLGKVRNAWFISLQKGEAAQQPGPMEWSDWTQELNDFSDTAALIANLDLVITADTAVAHLAGAMAKAVWVLLPLTADWRWLVKRDDSPWYPTMTLYRQVKAGDWSDPVARILDDLTLT